MERVPGRGGTLAVATLAALAALAAVASPVLASDALDPFRALATSTVAPRLIAEARAAMRAHFGLPPEHATAASLAGGEAPGWPAAPTAIYLSLVRGRATRACVGAAIPPGGSLGESVRILAVQTLQLDRRRPPVRADELDDLRIVIAFAGPPEPIAEPWSVAVAREGLLIAAPGGNVAFLPGEARTVAWALREARRAGVGDLKYATYSRFDVVTLTETPSTPPRGSAPRARSDPDDSP